MTAPAATLRAAAEQLRRPCPRGPFTTTSAAAAIFRARLPLADWLDSWTDIDAQEDGPMPEDLRHALTIARKILGEDTN